MSKEKKIIIAIVFGLMIFTIFPSILNINKRTLRTDSGFDSDWDSGDSWDSSDSWDSGSSWDSGDWGSSGSFGSGGDSAFVLIFIVLVIIIICVSTDSSKQRFNSYSNYDSILQKARITSDSLKEFNLEKKQVLNDIFDILKKMEMSYSNDSTYTYENIMSPKVQKFYDDLNSDGKYYTDGIDYVDGFIYYSEKNQDGSLNILVEIVANVNSAIVPENKKITADDYKETTNRYRLNVIYNGNYTIDSIELISKSDIDDFSNMGIVPDRNINEKLEKLNIDKERVLVDAYKIYVDVQNAWMNDTLDDVRSVISDEMYNQYQAQLTTLRVKKQKNVMEDFKYLDGYILNIKETKKVCYIKVIMGVSCKDYLINKESEKEIRGNSKRTNIYRYSFVFMIGKETLEKCPNCGAELEKEGSSVTCSYCGSKIERISTNMVLVEKKMLSQSY